MLQLPAYVEDLRKEGRLLRIYTAQLKRANIIQKEKLKKIEDILKHKDKRIRDLEKENEKLKKEIERITASNAALAKTKNRYQVALFDHGNFKHPDDKSKKTNGGQKGHADTNQDKFRDKASFKKQRLFAAHCGNCGNILPRVNSVKEKTLIDIQISTELIKLILQSERQWCKTCKCEVTARSVQTLPFTEYGINTFMMVLLLRFKSHQSASNISSVLSLGFGLTLSTSAILSLLRQAKYYLKGKYEELKKAIRKGSVMYNDETG